MNNWMVIDYETYYDTEYSLSKIPAHVYVHDERFEEQCLSYYCPMLGMDRPATVTTDALPAFYEALRKHAHNLVLVGQNTIGFDALILAKHGIFFKGHVDTQVLSRYRWGSTVLKHSLEAIADRLDLSPDPTMTAEVQRLLGLSDADMQESRKLSQALAAVKGKYVRDIPDNLYKALCVYCESDVWLTWLAAQIMTKDVPASVYRTMTYNGNTVARAPLVLDIDLLKTLKDDFGAQRTLAMTAFFHSLPDDVQTEMVAAVATKKAPNPPPELIMLKYIRSNDKMVWLLGTMGINDADIPRKQGKNGLTYAFAKTDVELIDFAASFDPAESLVPDLIDLRLEFKTSNAESKIARLIAVGEATPDRRFGMHIHTYGATNTARHSGGNAMGSSPHNISRAKPMFYPASCHQPIRFSEDIGIRDAICAPPGKVLIVYDSSGIELRAVGYITQEPAITDPLADKTRDLYVEMAQRILSRPDLTKKDKKERFLGKLCALSLQYLTGWRRLRHTSIIWGNEIDEATAQLAHTMYRVINPNVEAFWGYAGAMLAYWSGAPLRAPEDYGCLKAPDGSYRLKGCRAITLMPDGLRMPNGFRIRYPSLQFTPPSRGNMGGYTYWNGARKSRARVHAGLVLENISQAIVTQIMDWQLDQIMQEISAQNLPAQYAGQVHDENIFVCDPEYEFAVSTIVQKWMKTPPPWWPELVLGCDGGNGFGMFEDDAPFDSSLQRYGWAK